ncbi:hypothetical protein BN14_05976 [Rhizoctonia solani AG-1 IB]|uniref:Transmembrane protein n=1 Tax=Thanatephorus cucumeris (strain AG1-IB / isolate 7/3/14) TaxID=1108050 RepID=M5BXD4_THACB|nr:hypothetical protein BN14_05976 [Rhizoctonia solani AG-1 IB]
MPAFNRFASLLILLLSFVLLSLALPTPNPSYSEESDRLQLPVSNATPNKVLHLLTDLEEKIKEPMRLVVEANSYSEVRAQVEVVVSYLETCSEGVLAAGKQDVGIDESMEEEIANRVAAIVSIIVRSCLEVSLKLGWFLVFGIFAKIDVCLKLLIVNLGTCGEGIVSSIAKVVASTCAQLLISLNFNQAMTALSITSL